MSHHPPPIMPEKPDIKDKTAWRQAEEALQEHNTLAHIAESEIELLEETFTGCLSAEHTDQGLPPDFTLKKAFICVLKDCFSTAEKNREHLKCGKAVTTMTFIHQPKSASLANSLLELERLKRLQQIAEPGPGAGASHAVITINTHSQFHEGHCGCTDMAQELPTLCGQHKSHPTSASAQNGATSKDVTAAR